MALAMPWSSLIICHCLTVALEHVALREHPNRLSFPCYPCVRMRPMQLPNIWIV